MSVHGYVLGEYWLSDTDHVEILADGSLIFTRHTPGEPEFKTAISQQAFEAMVACRDQELRRRIDNATIGALTSRLDRIATALETTNRLSHYDEDGSVADGLPKNLGSLG